MVEINNNCIIDEKLTLVTCEILNRINSMKQEIKKSMMVGERNILKGITIFEEVFKELNPLSINDEIVSNIENYVDLVLISHEEKVLKVNQYVHFGVYRCYNLLEAYNKFINRNRNEKKKILN